MLTSQHMCSRCSIAEHGLPTQPAQCLQDGAAAPQWHEQWWPPPADKQLSQQELLKRKPALDLHKDHVQPFVKVTSKCKLHQG